MKKRTACIWAVLGGYFGIPQFLMGNKLIGILRIAGLVLAYIIMYAINPPSEGFSVDNLGNKILMGYLNLNWIEAALIYLNILKPAAGKEFTD